MARQAFVRGEKGERMDVYNVTVVGPSGSGKTVFLASLFRRLAVQREDAEFFVQTDFSSAKLLNHTYGEITRPGEWPEATLLSQISELTFTCSVRSSHGVFSPFAVKYVDYGGEIITDVPELGATAAAEIEGRLGASEVLLVFFDGVKVLDYLGGDSRLIDELVPVFNQMQGSDAVAHFVITKWDLLHTRYTLQAVADSLMEDPIFRSFIAQRSGLEGRQKGIVRLFPVSSVGLGFADPDPNGGMVKRPGAKPHPLNVEIPFAAILPDLFEQAYESIADPSPSPELERRTRLLARLRSASSLLPTARTAFHAATIRSSPKFTMFGEGLLNALNAWATSRIGIYEGRLEDDWDRHRAGVEKIADERTAIKHLVEGFELLLADFERANPGSRLSTETTEA